MSSEVVDRHESLDPPKVTPERLERLEAWVRDYVADLYQVWKAGGQPVDSEAGRRALAAAAASMRCPDIPTWMPLAEAIWVNSEIVSGLSSVSPADVRNAMRTYKSATPDEIDSAICNQLGWDQLSLNNFRDRRDGQSRAGEGKCALYRYFDADDRLLYVGIAKDPNMRDNQHRVKSKWHQFQARRTVEWHDTKRDAMNAEREAIRSECPVFNLTHASPAQKAASMDYLFDQIEAAS